MSATTTTRLERTQQSTDVTEWLTCFLAVLGRAVENAQSNVSTVLAKAHFWQRWNGAALNERQVKAVSRLLDGFEGKPTTSKWSAITKYSQDTALRDITVLVDLGLPRKSPVADAAAPSRRMKALMKEPCGE